eukprot:2658993-Prorocentrum_lima.AAC.1
MGGGCTMRVRARCSTVRAARSHVVVAASRSRSGRHPRLVGGPWEREQREGPRQRHRDCTCALEKGV